MFQYLFCSQNAFLDDQASFLLLQNRIEEWIKEWRLSPSDSRDLYLDTAALLRTNKVSSHTLLSKPSHTLSPKPTSLAGHYTLAKSAQSHARPWLLLSAVCMYCSCVYYT